MNPELLILIIILLFVVFFFFFSRNNKREEIKFPFRAIEKEKPTQIILQIQQPTSPQPTQNIQSSQPSQPINNNPPLSNNNTIQQLMSNQQVPMIREMYPVPFIRGDEYKKNYMRGTIGLRDMDRPYQDITTEFIRVGTVFSENQQDDTVMTLYRRDISPERDLYEYKVVDKTNGNDLELYLSTNVNFLRNGDKIIIPGYENKGNFVVNLDSRYRYTMLRPFY
jgi:hypothetical protein